MTSMQVDGEEKSLEEKLKDAENDLSSLSRVSHRLAMVDSEKLAQVLDKLLPRLLLRIGENHQSQLLLLSSQGSLHAALTKIHAKLVEMLSHTMKRVREDKQCQIPCRGILQLLVDQSSSPDVLTAKETVDPFTLNLSLTFLTLGLSRSTLQEWEGLLPGLLVLHGYFSSLSPEDLMQSPSTKSQWHQVTHLLFRTMDLIMQDEEKILQRTSPASSFTTNSSKRLKSSETAGGNSSDTNATTTPTEDPLVVARNILARDETTASAFYELLLDIILYQTTPSNSSVPPPGLSQAGHIRLKSGASETARDWAAEMAPRSRLVQIKSRCLDWIAPSRRWGLFMGDTSGLTRTLALLIAAAGDPTPEVSQRAITYLKQHLDAERDVNTVYGDPARLLQELLVLCVGASNAQLVLAKQQQQQTSSATMTTTTKTLTLGIYHEIVNGDTNQQATLSFRRRMVSETTFATMVDYVAKILEEVPQVFSQDDALLQQQRVGSVGSLAVLACTKMLSQLRTSSGLTMLRGKQYVSAAQLLNALVVRLSTIKTPASADGTDDYSIEEDVVPTLLAKSMAIACTCLSTVVSSKSNTMSSAASQNRSSGSEGNTSVRDALYGVICVLSRSNLPLEKMSWLFALGETPSLPPSTVSIETAVLLFGCIAGEEEALRPRAVAALDALLASYCRLISKQGSTEGSIDTTSQTEQETSKPVADNPWGQMTNNGAPEVDANVVTTTIAKTELAKLLLPLLWNAAQHSQPKQSRVATARWAGDLLTLLDLTNACHLLCFLSGDSDVTAAAIAREALNAGNLSRGDESTSYDKNLADFAELVGVLFAESAPGSSSWRPSFWEFTPKGRAMAVEYLLECLLHDIYGGDDDAMQTFVSAIATSIIDATSQARREYLELLDGCAGALSLCLSTSSLARSLVASNNIPLGPETIKELALGCNSSKARRLLAESWGYLYKDTLLWENNVWAETVEAALRSCCDIVEGKGASMGNKHGAAFLGGACIKVYRQHPTLNVSDNSMASLASAVLGLMGKEVLNSDDVIGNAFVDGLGIACSYDQEDAPILEDALVPGASLALSNLTEAIRKYGNGETIDVPRVSKLAKAAGTCLACTTATPKLGTVVSKDLGDARLKAVDALFLLLGSTAFRKDEEVALWAGEALAAYSDAYSPKDVEWSTSKSVWPEENNEEFALALPPHQQVIYKLLRRATFESSPHKKTATAPALFAIVARAAKQINLDSSRAHRCLVKEICTRLEDIQSCFITLLADPKSKHLSRESCCLGLAACRSLANISSASVSDDMNNRLLRAFGQTTIHGGSAMQETPEQAAERRRLEGNDNTDTSAVADDTTMANAEVGGASGIGEASLGAYREMAGAAMSLGRPDILYALLMLSVSNPAWSAEGRDYGPSALLGQQSFAGSRSNAAEMRTALKGHLGKLIPRILRGCHSPNKETRAQMQNLWNGMTGGGAEARSAITQHLLVTIDTLIEDTTSKLWRTRLGACGALAQVIVGRSWIELGGGPAVLFDDDVVSKTTTEVTTGGVRLLRVWRVAMRSLDDVRVNVREAGEALGRGVRSLTLRLVDPNALKDEDAASEDNAAHEKDASAAAATALRWLIKHGLKQPCPEAAGVCVSCLVGIVDVANPSILQPLVPDLLRSLLLAMSSLEPAAFNYLQVRAAGQDRGSGESYDSLERLRLQIVQSGPIATAVTKCLDMMPHMDLKIQKAVVPELDSAIRLSAGLTTRTAAADCVSTLCATCPNAFKNSGPSSTNPSVSLLRALYSASERERGQAARDKYAHVCGNLAALCPGSSVRSLALRAAEKYNASTGSNDDPAARKAAAITLRAIAVKASNQFSDGGNSDIWCRRVLPVAFLGMRDHDPKVASLFADVWEEGGSAANLSGAADGFGNLLEEKLILSLVKECVKALNDVSWSRRVTGAVALQELANKEILSPAPRRVNGGTKDGMLEESVRAQRRAQASNMALVALVKIIADTRLWSGKQHVIESCSVIASKWSSALANTKNPSELLGVGAEPSSSIIWTPLFLTTSSDTDSLFVNDQRFKEEVETELPEEAAQDAETSMDIDEDPNDKTQLNFEDDGLGDEKAEASGAELSPEETDITEVKELVPTYIGLCRLFLVQAFPSKRSVLSVKEEEVLPYRAAVLKALSQLLDSIDVSAHGIDQKKIAFDFVASRLTPLFDRVEDDEGSKEESPLIVSRAIDSFAACFWEDFGDPAEEKPSLNGKYRNILELSKSFQRCSAVERPWTVKSSSLKACASLVSKAASASLRDYATISAVVECASLALKDRKFWKVRYAGLEVLHALVTRCGQSNTSNNNLQPRDPKTQERQLVLEAVLPHKEKILTLAKQTLRDSEAKVTALSSQILSSMTWWP